MRGPMAGAVAAATGCGAGAGCGCAANTASARQVSAPATVAARIRAAKNGRMGIRGTTRPSVGALWGGASARARDDGGKRVRVGLRSLGLSSAGTANNLLTAASITQPATGSPLPQCGLDHTDSDRQ